MNRKDQASSLQQLSGLIWSIISTTFSSLCLSIPLLFRQATATPQPSLGETGPFRSAEADQRDAISFFKGTVWHERKSPCLHKFSYSVRYAFVNLDYAPSSFTSSSATHHMTASKARSIAGTAGPVYLLTVPTSVGYEQNPLSVYYCFNNDETRLLVCIAEVTNTPWGERVTFLFDPNGDAVAKPLHVSPFMDMSGVWRMKACVPDQNITITIKAEHPDYGSYFTASLFATRVDCFGTNSESFFWLMPHKTALGIYWQALLLWLKGVSFHQHPKYIDGNAYQQRATLRDNDISLKGQKIHHNPAEGSSSCSMGKTSSLTCIRSFTWNEARWPWN